jgi:hypothetical protein
VQVGSRGREIAIQAEIGAISHCHDAIILFSPKLVYPDSCPGILNDNKQMFSLLRRLLLFECKLELDCKFHILIIPFRNIYV